MNGRIAALTHSQVKDVSRPGLFRVGVEQVTREGQQVYHQGLPVYQDAYGERFTIR